MGFAAKQLLGVPYEPLEVHWQGAVLLGCAQDLIPEHLHVLQNGLVFNVKQCAGFYRSTDGLHGIRLQVVWLESRVIEIIIVHGLHRNAGIDAAHLEKATPMLRTGHICEGFCIMSCFSTDLVKRLRATCMTVC